MRVLLPLKEFAAAKQRLAGVLSAPERQRLFQCMVEDVLFALSGHPQVDEVVICSSDPVAAWLACYYEVSFLSEAALHCSGLNGAVNAAARHFAREGGTELLATELMVVHGDLPLLDAADISALLAAHRRAIGAAVTIAPDRRRGGTNLLAWRPLGHFETRYGIDSFQRHCDQARALGAELSVCELPGGSFDIDEPADLLELLQRDPRGQARYTMTFLHDSGVAERLRAMLRGADNDIAGEVYAGR